MFSHRLIAALAVVCSHIQFTEALLNNCLGPSGVQDFKLFACNPEASESACCSPGDICYSNGLCAPGPTLQTGITPFFLDGCTNNSFTSPACIPNCLTITGNGIQTCPNVGPNHFCCYGFNGCNCSDPSAVFTLAAGLIVTTIDPSATYTASSASTTSTTIATTTSSSSPTGSASNSATPSPKSNNNGVAIGVGVGVGTVAVGLLAGLGYFFIRRRNARANTAELSADQPPPPPAFGSPQEYYSQPKPQGYAQQGYPSQGYPQTPMTELSTDQHYQPVGELPSHQF